MRSIRLLIAAVSLLSFAMTAGDAAVRCQVVHTGANDVQYPVGLDQADAGIHARTGNPISPWAMIAASLPVTQSSPAVDLRYLTIHETHSAIQMTIHVTGLKTLSLYPETFARYVVSWRVGRSLYSYQARAEVNQTGWRFWAIAPFGDPYAHPTTGRVDIAHNSITINMSRSFMRNPGKRTVFSQMYLNSYYEAGDARASWPVMDDWNPYTPGTYRLGSGC